ncbi:MAG: cation-transporting P-type ATPase, partial [Legionellaceae bacterium]
MVAVSSFLGAMGTALGFLLMGICFFMTGPLSWVVQGVIAGVSTLITLVLGAEFYQSVFLKLKKGILTMDTLFVISTSVSLVASLAAFISPVFPMMFEAGLLIFGFRHLGLALYDAFKQDVLTQRRFQDQAPVTVLKKSAQGTQRAPLNSLVKGDIIELKSGDILPVDGYFDASDGL